MKKLEELKVTLDTLQFPAADEVAPGALEATYTKVVEALSAQAHGERKSIHVAHFKNVNFNEISSVAGALAKAGYIKQADFLTDLSYALQKRGKLFTSPDAGRAA